MRRIECRPLPVLESEFVVSLVDARLAPGRAFRKEEPQGEAANRPAQRLRDSAPSRKLSWPAPPAQTIVKPINVNRDILKVPIHHRSGRTDEDTRRQWQEFWPSTTSPFSLNTKTRRPVEAPAPACT